MKGMKPKEMNSGRSNDETDIEDPINRPFYLDNSIWLLRETDR